jgi:pyruvate/2-oxoglutarate dehydrogenase complex dihydrolipoamide dehydrogenase (E3) component
VTNRPRRFDRNLIVIGAGSAGLVCALVAAKLGAKVTLAEAGRMGGDCLNTGCVPSKALIHAARLVAQARAAAAMGLLPPAGAVDSAAAFRHVRASIAAVAPHDSVERYRGLGIDVRHGHARITSPWSVDVAGTTLTTRAIVIATGAAPSVPPIPGLADSGYLTSETLWRLRAAPRRLLILGGGPIGCELALAFARLGAAVTLVESGPHLLAREDDAVRVFVQARLERDGVRVLTGQAAVSVTPGELVTPQHRIGFDALLVAVGRTPRVSGFGLEALGIALTERGTVAVNAYLQTRHRNIYACGDVAGPFQFTHAAGHQGWIAAVNALFGGLHPLRPEQRRMPAVTFTDPEIARVGLTEREARADGVRYELTSYALADLDRAIVDDAGEGFVRVLTAPGRDHILGATIVAPRAGEMLAEFVLAQRQGVGLKGLQGTIHAYPTYAEASAGAGGVWRAAHSPAWAIRLLARYHGWRRG